MLTHTEIISQRKEKTWYGEVERTHSITYQLGPTPYRVYSRFELPESHELEDWETDDDSWIRANGNYYNLNEFCTVGMPHLPGPMGGAQLAAGDFLVAGYQGEVYPVSWSESRPL